MKKQPLLTWDSNASIVALEMAGKGAQYIDIAKELGCRPSQVRYHLHKELGDAYRAGNAAVKAAATACYVSREVELCSLIRYSDVILFQLRLDEERQHVALGHTIVNGEMVYGDSDEPCPDS